MIFSSNWWNHFFEQVEVMASQRWKILYLGFPVVFAFYNGFRGSQWVPDLGTLKTILLYIMTAVPVYLVAALASYGFLKAIRPTKLHPVLALVGGAATTILLAYFYFVFLVAISGSLFPGLKGALLSQDGHGLIGGFSAYITSSTGVLFGPIWIAIHYVYELATKDTLFFPGLRKEPDSGEEGNAHSFPTPGFLDRLPSELGRNILAVEAQEHYVRVYTDRGDDLVLYRFGDVVRDLNALGLGMQVHRSYWVSERAIKDVQRAGKSYRLTLSNDLEVPVSVSYRGTIQQYQSLNSSAA